VKYFINISRLTLRVTTTNVDRRNRLHQVLRSVNCVGGIMNWNTD